MSQSGVTMDVRKVNERVCVLDVDGEINASAEPVLMQAYHQACTYGMQSLVLNFSDLKYMNSSGIGLIVTLLIRMRRQNQRLLAFGLNDHYCEIFELTQLNEAIAIFASEEEAVKAAG